MIIDCNVSIDCRETESYDADIQSVVKNMKLSGIDRVCAVSVKGFKFDYNEGNDEILELASKNDRIIPVAVFNAKNSVNIQADFEKVVQMNFGLLRFWNENMGTAPWSISSLIFKEMVRCADESGMPFMLSAERDASSLDSTLEGVKVPVILANIGYDNLSETILLLKKNDNLLIDTSRLTTPDGIELMCRLFGDSRLVFGSNYPFWSFASARMNVEKSDISDNAKDRILSKNILGILKGR